MKKRWKIISTLLILSGLWIGFISSISEKKNPIESEEKNMKENLSINVNGSVFKIILEANATSEALKNMLPLKITMKELNGNEKYFDLEKSLPANPARVEKIEAGDIMLYEKDCLVIFYEDFKTSYSYTRIGKIENIEGLKKALGLDNVEVEIY